MDTTVLRAHQHAAGRRSYGGLSTKLHLACEQGSRPLAMLLTVGQRGFTAVLDRIWVPACEVLVAGS